MCNCALTTPCHLSPMQFSWAFSGAMVALSFINQLPWVSTYDISEAEGCAWSVMPSSAGRSLFCAPQLAYMLFGCNTPPSYLPCSATLR